MEKENKSFFDTRIAFMQVLGIILVVVGHSFYHHEDNVLFSWIYSFHMPLFFFISGYLIRYSMDNRGKSLDQVCNGRFLAKKAYRLLLPYVVVSTVAFFPKIMLGRFAGRPLDLSLEAYGYMLLYPLDNVISYFWFLPSMFTMFAFACLVGTVSKKVRVPVMAILVGALALTLYFPRYSIDPWNYSGTLAFLFFFVLGYGFKKYGWESLLKHAGVLFPLSFAVSLLWPVLYAQQPEWIELPGIDTLFACNGILMCFCLAQLAFRKGVEPFKPFYGSVLCIYLLSWFFQTASQQVFLGLTGAPWGVGSILAMVSGFFGPYVFYRLFLFAKKKCSFYKKFC